MWRSASQLLSWTAPEQNNHPPHHRGPHSALSSGTSSTAVASALLAICCVGMHGIGRRACSVGAASSGSRLGSAGSLVQCMEQISACITLFRWQQLVMDCSDPLRQLVNSGIHIHACWATPCARQCWIVKKIVHKNIFIVLSERFKSLSWQK